MPRRTLLVRYSGRVQGVGFRATCRALAQSWDLKGWVRNEADGTVLMVVSGEAADVDAFLEAVRRSRLAAYIERELIEPQPAGDWSDFEIRY
jgi:acylphosphatase